MSATFSSPEVISSGHKLLEAPLFDDELGLVFTDAEVGGVWSLDREGRLQLIIPHRRGIGGIALHETGGLIVSGRNVAFKAIAGGATKVLLDSEPANGHVGYNDLVTDRLGRIYVGSLSYVPMLGQRESDRTGGLHLIDLDGRVRQVAGGIRLSNGLGFSPDGKRLYYADTQARRIYVFDVADDGLLSSQTVFVALEGMPDGLIVAQDGSVWVAVVHAGVVVRYASNGTEIHRIPFPTPMVTSLCFGGGDNKTLYVVSGAEGAIDGLGGCIYRLRVDVAGVKRYPARVRLG
jgi:sugar lactone lactonase YvrE